MVERRSPKPLVRVRFLHRPQENKRDIISFILDEGIERRSATARVGVARFFNKKILVTDGPILCLCGGIEKLFINNEEFIPSYLKRSTVPVRKDSFIARNYFKNFFRSLRALDFSLFLSGFIQIVFLSRLNQVFCRLA